MKTCNFIETKNVYPVLEFNQSQWLKQYVEFNIQKRTEDEKIEDEGGKVLYKLLDIAVYKKVMENLRSRTDLKLVSKKGYLKWTYKPN